MSRMAPGVMALVGITRLTETGLSRKPEMKKRVKSPLTLFRMETRFEVSDDLYIHVQ